MYVLRLPKLLILGVALFASQTWVAEELKLLDKPLWIFPGQTFRIAVEQPAGSAGTRVSGSLEVDVPPAVEMFDTWPKDSIQRFYFRALQPGDATVTFRGKAGTLQVPLEVIPWSDVFKPHTFNNLDLPRIWPLGEHDYGHLKKRRTFYGDEEIQAMQR